MSFLSSQKPQAAETSESYAAHSIRNIRKKVLIGVFCVGLIVAFFILFTRDPAPPESGLPADLQENRLEEDNSIVDNDRIPEIEEEDPFPNDHDRDGILNEEERSLGLDPFEFDSDGDGISDADEINIWKTDPKNEDTDGDGFADGFELINGYNPAGEGTLGAS